MHVVVGLITKRKSVFTKTRVAITVVKKRAILPSCAEQKRGVKKMANAVGEKKGKKMKGKLKKQVNRVEAEAKPGDSDTTDSKGVGLQVVKVANATRQDSAASAAIWVRPKVERKIIEMELNTGAAVSNILEELYNAAFSSAHLRATNTGQIMTSLGVIKANVHLNKQWARLPLYVVKRDAPPLFGRE